MIDVEVDPFLQIITIDGMRFSWEFFEMIRDYLSEVPVITLPWEMAAWRNSLSGGDLPE